VALYVDNTRIFTEEKADIANVCNSASYLVQTCPNGQIRHDYKHYLTAVLYVPVCPYNLYPLHQLLSNDNFLYPEQVQAQQTAVQALHEWPKLELCRSFVRQNVQDTAEGQGDCAVYETT